MDDHTAPDRDIDRTVALLRESERLLFITGAGVSADSGLPTYRGVGGLYDVDDTEEGLPIEVLLSGSTFRKRPEVTWKYLGQVEEACRGATFNRAHEVIREAEEHFGGVWVLTQNVDGFHRAAGSRNVIDIHGDLHELICTSCRFRGRVPDFSGLDLPPRCGACGGMLRPDVVLFGEALPAKKVARLYEELLAGFDMVFSVGTTSLFPYIAEPVLRARQAGKPTVEINPGSTEVSEFVDIKISSPAAAALDAIWTRFTGGAHG